MLCGFLTDINTLLPHFVAENIISLDDIDGIHKESEKVRKLLLHISGPLSSGHTEGFYTMLKIMEQYGTQATQQLATMMRSLLPSGASVDHSSGKSFSLLHTYITTLLAFSKAKC